MTTKTLTSRRLAALAAPALLALSLTACGGGGSSAPEDASQEEFCSAYNSDEEPEDFDPEASADEQAKALKESFDKATDKLKDVGTPEDIPDDARDGFEVFIDTISDLSEDDIKEAIESEDFDSLESKVDEDDQKKAEAFTDWADDYCADDSSSDTEPSSDAT